MLNEIIEGDCINLLKQLPNASIDAVITDPPYPKEFMPLYGQMAAELPRVLKPGGSLLAIVPQYALPQILNDVGKHLKYRWIISMWQGKGAHPRMAMGIEVMWKPIVWWVNGTWPQGRGFVKDGFENNPVDKTSHEWEQATSWADYCLKFVPPGGTVLDPFAGAATVALQANKTGHNWIMFEKNPRHVEVAKQRLEYPQLELWGPAGK